MKLDYMKRTQSDVVEEGTDKRKKRHLNILWFNPPCSSNIRTNVAAKFLSLVRKHFPPSSPLHAIFNTKKIKVSYSTCPNMKNYIASHNARPHFSRRSTMDSRVQPSPLPSFRSRGLRRN